jgi:hypothetical protein
VKVLLANENSNKLQEMNETSAQPIGKTVPIFTIKHDNQCENKFTVELEVADMDSANIAGLNLLECG